MERSRNLLRRSFVSMCLLSSLPFVVLAQHPVLHPNAENVTVPADGESIPMLDYGGRPLVEVMINGKGPYRFILDTGATLNVVDTSVAAELGLADRPTIEEFKLGKVAVRNVPAFTNPISKMFGADDAPRGVLSASSFPGALVQFDYPAKQIRVVKGAIAEPDGKTIFEYDPNDLPTLPVNVAGHKITVHLDTGAPYALALPTKYMKELPLTAEPVEKGKAKTHSGALPIFMAPLKGDVMIGEFVLPIHDLRFTDVVPFASAEPKGQVGNESFSEFVVTLDSMHHRVRLEKPEKS
jgi:hypothetical protein